jgi:hypothetical protein
VPKPSSLLTNLPQALLPTALVLLLVTCQFLMPGLLAASPKAGYLSSDDFYLVALGRNLLGGACSMSGTHLSGVPYLFPDLTVLLPCLLTFSNVNLVFLGYSLLFITALVAVMAWIARLLGYPGKQAFLLGCTGVLFLVATNLGKAYRFRAHHFFVAGNHAGVFLNGFLLTALVLRSFHRPFNPLTAALFVVIGTLGAFSDRLLVVQFFVPMALTLPFLAIRRFIDLRQLATGMTLMLVCVLGAIGVSRGFAHLGFVLLRVEKDFHPAKPWQTFTTFLHDLPAVFHGQYMAIVVIPLFYALTTAVILRLASRSARGENVGSRSPDQFAGGGACAIQPAASRGLPVCRVRVVAVALIALLGCLSNLGAVIFLGMWEEPCHERYLFFPLIVPFLLFGPLFLRVPQTGGKRASWAWSLLIAGFAVYRIWAAFPEPNRRTLEPPYPELARAVDQLARERGFRYGLAEFWTAKHVSYLSREGVNVRAILPSGEPYLHCDNPNCYLAPDPGDLEIPRYNFIIVPKGKEPIDKARLVAEFGGPEEVKGVGDQEIWIYERLLSRNLQQFLNGALAEKCCRRLRFIGPRQPEALAVPKRNFSNRLAKGNVKVRAGQQLEVLFAEPVQGRMLNISARHDDRLEVTFYQGEWRLGRLEVPEAVWSGSTYNAPGMQARLLPLPPSVRGLKWNRAVVRANPRSGTAGVIGHFLVFGDCPVPEVPAWDLQGPLVVGRTKR